MAVQKMQLVDCTSVGEEIIAKAANAWFQQGWMTYAFAS